MGQTCTEASSRLLQSSHHCNNRSNIFNIRLPQHDALF
jgi:hypothetical protein